MVKSKKDTIKRLAFDISHPKDTFWWFIHYWWHVDDSPEQNFTFGEVMIPNWNENEIPEGSSPWLVHSDLQWGSLFGGGNTELWLWDGRHCKFVETKRFGMS